MYKKEISNKIMVCYSFCIYFFNIFVLSFSLSLSLSLSVLLMCATMVVAHGCGGHWAWHMGGYGSLV